MLLHTPDPTFARLASCWKRATSFAQAGCIDPAHPLAVPWANCEFMLSDSDNADDLAFDLCCLDWFALKLDEFAKTHILKGDLSVAAILFNWKRRMFIEPMALSNAAPRTLENSRGETL